MSTPVHVNPLHMSTRLFLCGRSGDDAASAVGRAIAAGFNHFHTAYDYFNLPALGAALSQVPRDSIFVSSMTSPCIHPAAPPKRNVTDPEACYNLTLAEAMSTIV